MARFDDLNIRRGEVPNIDYICAVEVDGPLVCYREYPMPDFQGVEIELEAVVVDDSQSLLDLQEVARAHIPNAHEFLSDFLAPLSYTSVYCDLVRLPTALSGSRHQQELEKLKQSIDELTGPFEIDVPSRFLDDASICRTVPKPVYCEYKIRMWNYRLKKAYARNFLRYIHSCAYYETLTRAKLKERIGADVKMYSADNIGWTTYTYKINDDVTIQLDSNFGFGQASYFYLGLSYKGIELLPYSAFVRYRYANVRELLRHTFSYRQERESWSAALRYVVMCANRAITAPDDFVGEFVWGEVQKMLEGLGQICAASKFIDCLNPDDDERVQYLGVRSKYNDPDMIAVLPEEMLVMLKAEKVIGALAILEKLRSLPIIEARVSAATSDILFKLRSILPELKTNAEHTVEDLRERERELRKVKDELREFEKRQMESSRDQLRSGSECRRDELMMVIERLECDINGRRLFLEEIQKCYGVGAAGERFLEVVEKLVPHMKAIGSKVKERVESASATSRSSAFFDKVEQEVQSSYIEAHPELAPLFKVRTEVLSGIDGFRYSQCRPIKKKGERYV